MPLPATVGDCLKTARMFLNDVNQQLWTDPVLMPMFTQAHLELQAKLKSRASPIMRGFQTIPVSAGLTQLLPPPLDMTSPIHLWEKPQGASPDAFQPMTETDMLPFISQTTSLVYWAWLQDTVMFVGAIIGTDVFVDYWRRIFVPTSSAESIGIMDGEQYLGPRTAAIAAGSVGEENTSSVAAALADAQLQIVLSGNRSRAPQGIGISIHP